MFSFDIKNSYHHVLIFPPHQRFLSFPWFYKGKVWYFCSRFLPFGLSSALFLSFSRSFAGYLLPTGGGRACTCILVDLVEHLETFGVDLVEQGNTKNSKRNKQPLFFRSACFNYQYIVRQWPRISFLLENRNLLTSLTMTYARKTSNCIFDADVKTTLFK